MSAMLLNPMPNRQDVAQNSRSGAFRFVGVGYRRSVVNAAPASILAVRKSQHYRTPSLDGRRAENSASPTVPFHISAKNTTSARQLAHSRRHGRIYLPVRFGLSWVGHEYPIERKGNSSCVTKHGLLHRLPVLSSRHVAIRKQNRPYMAPVPVPVRPLSLMATWSRAPLSAQRPTLSIARKTQPNAEPLTARTNAPLPALSNQKPAAARLPTRGGFAYDLPITKRDSQCSKRS